MPSPDDPLRTPSPAPAGAPAGSPASMPERPAPTPPVFDTSAPSDAADVASGAGQIQDQLSADEKAAAEARRQREVQLKSAGVAVVRAFDQYALGDGSVASQRGPVAAAQILSDRWAEAHNIAGGVTARVDFDRNGDFHLRLFRKTDGFPVTDFDFAKMKASLQEGHYLDEHDEQLRQQLGITPADTETPSASLTFNQFAEQLLKLPRAMWDDYARNIGAAGLFYDGDENKMQETFTKLDAQAAAGASAKGGGGGASSTPSGWDFYGAFDAAMAGPGATKASMLGRLDAALDAGLINQEHYDALSEMLENRDWTSPSASSAPPRHNGASASSSPAAATDAGVSASAEAPFDDGASSETSPPNGTGTNDAPAAVTPVSGSGGAEPGKEPNVQKSMDDLRAEAAAGGNYEVEDMEWDRKKGKFVPKPFARPWNVRGAESAVSYHVRHPDNKTVSFSLPSSNDTTEERGVETTDVRGGVHTAREILNRMGIDPDHGDSYVLTNEQYEQVLEVVRSGVMPDKPQASEPNGPQDFSEWNVDGRGNVVNSKTGQSIPVDKFNENLDRNISMLEKSGGAKQASDLTRLRERINGSAPTDAAPPAADPLAEPAEDKSPDPTSEPEPVDEPEVLDKEPAEPGAPEEPADPGKPAPVMVGGKDLSDPAQLKEFEQKMQQQGYRVREIDGEKYLWHPKAKVWIGSDGHTMTSEGGIYREDRSGKLRWNTERTLLGNGSLGETTKRSVKLDHEEAIPKDMLAYLRFKNGQTEEEAKNPVPVVTRRESDIDDKEIEVRENGISDRSAGRIEAFSNSKADRVRRVKATLANYLHKMDAALMNNGEENVVGTYGLKNFAQDRAKAYARLLQGDEISRLNKDELRKAHEEFRKELVSMYDKMTPEEWDEAVGDMPKFEKDLASDIVRAEESHRIASNAADVLGMGKRDDLEHGRAVGVRSRESSESTGSSNKVSIRPASDGELYDAYHNHPRSSMFSVEDLRNAFRDKNRRSSTIAMPLRDGDDKLAMATATVSWNRNLSKEDRSRIETSLNMDNFVPYLKDGTPNKIFWNQMFKWETKGYVTFEIKNPTRKLAPSKVDFNVSARDVLKAGAKGAKASGKQENA